MNIRNYMDITRSMENYCGLPSLDYVVPYCLTLFAVGFIFHYECMQLHSVFCAVQYILNVILYGVASQRTW